jgi:hypothetical protein
MEKCIILGENLSPFLFAVFLNEQKKLKEIGRKFSIFKSIQLFILPTR